MTRIGKGPAYRVETERLVLRCWEPGDAPRLREALDLSDMHLPPFIPFMAHEPRSLRQTAEWLRGHRASFDLGQHFRYAVFDAEERSLLGETMLLDRAGNGEREIGYWQHVDHGGHGYATEAAAVMTRIALEVDGVDRVEIHCAPGNAASARVPAKLGFTHEATLRRRSTDTEGVVHDLMVWTLFAADLASSPVAAFDLRAFDLLGELLLD